MAHIFFYSTFSILLVLTVVLAIELTTPVLPDSSLTIPGFKSLVLDHGSQQHGISVQHRTSEPDNQEDGEHHDKLFFSLLSSKLTSCNYRTQPGSSCLNCHQTLYCMQKNVGIVRSCFFPFSYCNDGHCSIGPGFECSATTTPRATSTNSITTTTTTASTTTGAPTTTVASTITPTTTTINVTTT